MPLFPTLNRAQGVIPGLVLFLSSVVLSAQQGATLKAFLRDGSEFTATTDLQAIELHTHFGALQIPLNQISQIEFRRAGTGLHRVWTINQNLISGLIHHPFTVTTDEGNSRSLATAEIKQIKRSHGQDEHTTAPSASAGQYVITNDGDLLSGRLLGDSIALRRQGHFEPISWESIESIQLANPPTEALVLFRDGQQSTRGIDHPSIRLQLDWKTEIVLSSWNIRSIYCRPGFVPNTVRQLFSPVAERSTEKTAANIPFEGFVWIPPGQFTLGSDTNEAGRGSDEGPQTVISVTQGFWMSQTEVTQRAYTQLTGSNPSTFSGQPEHPVEKVSWHEAIAYCHQLTQDSEKVGKLPVGYVFRLPTEAEWEYACRAGSSTRFAYGNDLNESQLGRFAWYVENSDSTPHPVGQLEPNDWGLYDMHGNVWEWCLDQWHYAFPGGMQEDYQATEEGWLRVARGGSWLYSADHCRSANRDDYGPSNRCSDIGFRVVLARPLK